MRLGICSLFPLASTCAASPVNLYIASYSGGAWAGNLTTLSLIQDSNSAFSLQQTSTLNTSTNSPSWLTLDRQKGILYLIDEAVNGTNGTIVAYKKNSNGQLAELGRQKTLPGGVSATLFGVGGLAVAEYGSGFLQTFDVTSPENISLVQTWAFNSRREFVKGIITDRQAAPHPHQVILDPSGEHLFVPDLGADAIHIFSVAKNSSLKLTRQMPSEKMKPGTGPRHIAFVPGTAGNFRLYLVGELDGTVAAYHSEKLQVSGKPWVKLHLIARYDTLKPGVSFPPIRDGAAKVAVAEIAVTVSFFIFPACKPPSFSHGRLPFVGQILQTDPHELIPYIWKVTYHSSLAGSFDRDRVKPQ
jgi:6-phosphogluconolactonase (cycloisomerase 2 family)